MIFILCIHAIPYVTCHKTIVYCYKSISHSPSLCPLSIIISPVKWLVLCEIAFRACRMAHLSLSGDQGTWSFLIADLLYFFPHCIRIRFNNLFLLTAENGFLFVCISPVKLKKLIVKIKNILLLFVVNILPGIWKSLCNCVMIDLLCLYIGLSTTTLSYNDSMMSIVVSIFGSKHFSLFGAYYILSCYTV